MARSVLYALRPKVEADIERLVKLGVLEPVSHSEWATPVVLVVKSNGSVRLCGDLTKMARSVLYALRPKVEADIERLVKLGVLEPVSHSEWATPVVLVVKSNGSVRLCGDFKVTVNPVLIAEQYPLPVIEDLFAGLAVGNKLSKIDLSQAYLQMHVDEDSQKYLTIATNKGLYRYRRLPFGITSAPALFQHAMDQILSGLPGVQCYLDDILVTGRGDKEHMANLDKTLNRLEKYGLRVNKDKCDFFKIGQDLSTVNVLPDVQPYLSQGKELSVTAGCLMWGMRVIIPQRLRKSILDELHLGHCGIARMKELAQSYFWWPGLDHDIEEKATSCSSCQGLRNMPSPA
ncbi:uncharacterized protein K02A2.6-like [Erpetoichthys calabaricus]|uniref:uncharacterized protein K02A2.6-like n=1 Tax=Erpetoichthys calabaricus TaxID=27687 RepID=UPI002234264D|nr:uncharacterized protein K02A2.6-like [Erpetoichthys calabaricus]